MNMKNKLEGLKRLLPEDSEARDKVNEFFEVFTNTKKPCKDGEDDDCPDLVSPCCNAALKTCMGTLPLKVTCRECGSEYNLKELIDKS